MIYKTLHWYIFKELMRIFILTASALTTLLSFGGTFKPLTKQGLGILDLMQIITESMPAMLAYTIPMAALFASVLVYWRMSTDNEVVACRASGISFGSIVLPALVLGVTLALTDFVFVNYVVPVFAQRVEHLMRQDVGAMLAFNIAHQEPFKLERKGIVYADGAQLIHPPGAAPGETVVVLNGVAATLLNKDGKSAAIILARRAAVHFQEVPGRDETEAWVQLTDAAWFHPVTLEKVGGSIDRLPPDHAFILPSQTRAQPKFLKLDQLWHLETNTDENPDIAAVLDRMSEARHFQEIAQKYRAAIAPGQIVRFNQNGGNYVLVHVPAINVSPEEEISFVRTPASDVVVDQYRDGKPYTSYKCDAAALRFSDEDYPVPHVAALLELHGAPVVRKDRVLDVPETAVEGAVTIQPLVIDPDKMVPLSPLGVAGVTALSESGGATPALVAMMHDAQQKISELLRNIKSEKHSRGSFAIACLPLVLLGAALGILLRRRNPLAVFVVGFVPAIVLVLLITAGRRMVEWSELNATEGYMVIWAGNVILVALVLGVYAKLLRH